MFLVTQDVANKGFLCWIFPWYRYVQIDIHVLLLNNSFERRVLRIERLLYILDIIVNVETYSSYVVSRAVLCKTITHFFQLFIASVVSF